MSMRSRYVEVMLVVYGFCSVALGLFMMLSPGVFFDTLGAFGVRNDHYIFDNASFELPLGLLLLAAMRWSTWRVPALAFAPPHLALPALRPTPPTPHRPGPAGAPLQFARLALSPAVLRLALCSST